MPHCCNHAITLKTPGSGDLFSPRPYLWWRNVPAHARDKLTRANAPALVPVPVSSSTGARLLAMGCPWNRCAQFCAYHQTLPSVTECCRVAEKSCWARHLSQFVAIHSAQCKSLIFRAASPFKAWVDGSSSSALTRFCFDWAVVVSETDLTDQGTGQSSSNGSGLTDKACEMPVLPADRID
jgi:hypothetical protein